MSHYDDVGRPSTCIFFCALVMGICALYAEQAAWFFIMFCCGFVAWGMIISWREHARDETYWKGLATGLADQLIDRQNEMAYYQHANSVIEMMETIHGGRMYHGPITIADIHEPLLNSEEA